MAESQELTLVINATDNASAVLKKSQQGLEDFGKHSKRISDQAGGGMAEAMKGLTKFASTITGLPLGEFAKITADATKGIGGLSTALAAVPLALYEVNEQFRQFADRIGNLSVRSQSIGIMTGEFQALSDQLQGVTGSAESAQQTVSGLITFISRAQRMGTAERAFVSSKFLNPEEMQAQLARVSALDPSERVKWAIRMLREGQASREKEMIAAGVAPPRAKTDAALATEEIARGFQLPPQWRKITEKALENLKDATPKQLHAAEEMEKTTEGLDKNLAALDVAARDWKEKILSAIAPTEQFTELITGIITDHSWLALGAAGIALYEAFRGAAALVGKILPGLAGPATKAAPVVAETATGLAETLGAGGAALRFGSRLAPWAARMTPYLLPFAIKDALDKAQSQVPEKGFLGDTTEQLKGLREERARIAAEASDTASFHLGGKSRADRLHDIDMQINRLEYGGTQVPKFQHGGLVTGPTLGLLGEAGPEAIIPLGGGREGEHTKLLRENTEELRQLNDYLTKIGIGGGPGAIRVSGGGGGGAVPAGALGAATAGSAARMLGPGGGMGVRAGARPGGGGAASDSGQPDARPSGITGDPTVPSDILATAQHVALQGGPGAVSQFMKDQGYPKDGSWCGEFAASVVKASGYTPPKGAAVASNWRNFGSPVEGAPQPGDVAVRRGVRTGETGSHVTFVENFDPKTGTFTGLGGNQRGGAESKFKASGYEFRRPGAPAGDGMAASAGGGRGGRGAGLYQKLLAGYRNSGLVGVVPPDGAKFGIRTGSAEEWARFGTAVAGAESGFNPRSANTSDPGGSFGVFQYAHGQVPGGNAYDVDASVKAFIRDSESSVQGRGGLGGGILGRRFSTIGRHPGSVAEHMGEAMQAARLSTDGSALDRTHRVEGNASIDVRVDAPAGTSVRARADGLFKKTRLNRQTQMPLAEAGPVGPASIA